MQKQLELMAADDERIHFGGTVPRSEVGAHIRDSHVVVIPSLWECWPNTAREALMNNRPVLATPVGGLCEMVEPGQERLAHSRSLRRGDRQRDRRARRPAGRGAASDRVRRSAGDLREAGGRRRRWSRATAPWPSPPRRSAPRGGDAPLVSIVIPYFRLDRYLRETLASAAAQVHPATEIVIVNDGSLREEDRIVYELAEEFEARVITQVNSGLGAARNFGIAQSRGRYVLPLDADDVIAPEFVARCVHALERNAELAYVTSWVEYMDPSGRPASDEDGGYYPFGNWSELIERNNVGGTCVALIRRSLFDQGFAYSTDLTSYEDWLLYLELHHAGHHGGVIPERLIRYRVRDESMMRTVGAPRLGPPLRRTQRPSAGAADQLDRSRRGVGPMRERIVRSVPAEIVGYVVLAIGLAALLWSRIGDVDGFYLDEWLYVHASQYIWEHLPGGLVDPIPFWDTRSSAALLDAARATLGSASDLDGVHGRSRSQRRPSGQRDRADRTPGPPGDRRSGAASARRGARHRDPVADDRVAPPDREPRLSPVHVGGLRDRSLRGGAFAREAGRRVGSDRSADAGAA